MLQVYTGNGKGKTTAGIGMAIRSLGAGQKVLFAQFMKTFFYSEQKILQNISENLTLKIFGKPYFLVKKGTLDEKDIKKLKDKVLVYDENNPPKDYIHLVKKGLEELRDILSKEDFDLLILDEINMCLYYNLLKQEELENFLAKIKPQTEIIITGRMAPDWLLARADLVTDMTEVKHYYAKNVEARLGVEY